MIHNIHMLIESDTTHLTTQIRAAQEQLLVDAHRRGEHPWGSMRRECPLCQLGK